MQPNGSNKSAAGRREQIVREVSRVLGEQKRAATEMQAVVEQSGLPLEEVNAEFPDLYDLAVAVAAREADEVSRPLRRELDKGGDLGDVRGPLTEFAHGIHKAYSSVLIGFARVAMTEGSRQRAVRRRIFDEGLASVADVLRRYLEEAQVQGKLAVDNSGYAAECLMGLLREPLYLELTLHSQELTAYASSEEAVHAALELFLRGCSPAEVRA